jgi:hypothetical protein
MPTYQISGTGMTYVGNTSFLNDTTLFTPQEAFNFTGLIVVEPTIPASNLNNDLNQIDFGIYIGDPLDFDVHAGEIIWATNNAVHSQVHPNLITAGGAIDEVNQFVDANNNLVTTIDPNAARITNADQFI